MLLFFNLPSLCLFCREIFLFCRGFSLFCRELSLFCRCFLYPPVNFLLFCHGFLYSAAGSLKSNASFPYFAVPLFIPRLLSLFCRECSLFCRDFNHISVVLFFLLWHLWATIEINFQKAITSKNLNIKGASNK